MQETLTEKVYNAIRDDINNIRLSAGEFLVENEMAKRYGVSKAPVREALHRLCREGRLISYPRKGYLIVALSEKEFLQVKQLRLINEGFALKTLVRELSPEALKLLEQLANKESVGSNRAFHNKLAELTGNRFLEEIMTRLLDASIRTMNLQSAVHHGKELKNYHRRIVEALAEHNEDKAIDYLKMDLDLGNSELY